MEEYGKYCYRTHESYKEDICAEQRPRDCAPVGKLVVYKFFGHKPSKEHACQHTAYGKEDLPGKEVEEIEKIETCYL